jgi:hypothetical protein
MSYFIKLDNQEKEIFQKMIHMIEKQLSIEISKLNNQLDAPMFPIQRQQLEQQKKKYLNMQSLCISLGKKAEKAN